MRFGLFHAVERHAGPLRDHVHDVVFGDEDLTLFALFPPFGEDALELLFGLLLVVAQSGGFLEVLGFDAGAFPLAAADFLDLLFRSL